MANFLSVINECLETNEMGAEWKKGVVFPIKKKMEWNRDLNLTCPITLIETARKIMSKVLTIRLSKILSENKYILQNANYAALLNTSVFEPSKLVQGVVEDANKYKKEAWILFMDISKAYDSVNSKMLEKRLSRIKLPNKFIRLIIDVTNRFNKVIVGKEMTDEYKVEDGLDQEEV